MHELALTQSLIKSVIDHAEGKPVKTINLSVGLLSCVDGYGIQTCFDVVKTQYQQLQDASLHIDIRRPTAHCRDCLRHFQLKKIGEFCLCGSLNYALEGGEELTLNSILCTSHSSD